MQLTRENYFSKEADMEYMSVSQFKLFAECEAKALATIKGQEDSTQKEAFLEGQLFEELVSGDAKLFVSQHKDELISSRGSTAGDFKANFKKVVKSAERFNEQKFFKDIIDRSEKQVILTGEINKVKIKGKLDLLDLKNKLLPDIKCMADFNDTWDKKEKCYKPWYYTYNYVLQLAVYQELVKQNYNVLCDTCLLAATKENEPDLSALKFSNDLLDIELTNFKILVEKFDKIKKGEIEPNYCGHCDYCKRIKQITKFEEVI